MDGKPAGSTPLAVPLSAGRHEVVLKQAGFSEHRETLDVAAGAEVTDEVAGNIRMWAAVFLIGAAALTQLTMLLYPLTEKKYLEIVGEIGQRRAARIDAEG